MSPQPNTTPTPATLGILAGQGELPRRIIDACHRENRPVFVLGFEGSIDATALADVPHAIIRFGAIGDGLEALKEAGCHDLVMAGNIKRPSLTSLKPDAACTRLLKYLGKAIFGGDDALLRQLVAFLEHEGFAVVGVDSLLGGLLAGAGVLGKHKPNREQLEDIDKAIHAAKTLGDLDIGQAVIIERGYVLGVEAAEGTDALIARCAEHMREVNAAILVKAKKPDQESRADLPTIGTQTIEALHQHAYAGVAIEANATLMIDSKAMIALADQYRLFIYGWKK